MRIKTMTAGLLAALSLSLTVPFAAFAEETPAVSLQQTTEAVTEQVLSPVTIKKTGSSYYLYDTVSGQAVTGSKGIREYPAGSGSYYYFVNTKGRIYVNKLIQKKNKRYYADEEGKLASGFTKVEKNTYYFSPSTHAAVKGWKKIAGSYYYFTKKGVQRTGLQKIGKHTYYLDPDNNGARTSGWVKIKKKWQYFSRKGRRQYGLLTDPDTNFSYYTDSKGNRKTGLITFKGNIYYFDKNIGTTASGVKVGGAMATGWRKIKKKTYYFSNSGKAVKGFLKKDGNTYYFNEKGVMQTGTVTIGSTTYHFDKTSGAMKKAEEITGSYSIKVNQGTGVVTIYKGSTPIKAMLCSVGLNGTTPNGTFTLDRKIQWQPLFGDVYGQYTSRISGNILFHSVYYTRYRDENSLATAEFNKLGTPASKGCVRLSCADAYYIYANCPDGTVVTIFSGSASDDPLPRPSNLYINTAYDPTDPIKGD